MDQVLARNRAPRRRRAGRTGGSPSSSTGSRPPPTPATLFTSRRPTFAASSATRRSLTVSPSSPRPRPVLRQAHRPAPAHAGQFRNRGPGCRSALRGEAHHGRWRTHHGTPAEVRGIRQGELSQHPAADHRQLRRTSVCCIQTELRSRADARDQPGRTISFCSKRTAPAASPR